MQTVIILDGDLMRNDSYVFISYSRHDQDFVERLTKDLRASGIRIWRDIDSITPGTNWQIELQNGLLRAGALLYIASKNSLQSKWMERELEVVIQRTELVIPIVVDDAGYLLNLQLGHAA